MSGEEDDLLDRETAYGHNRKPEVEPKNYFELLWEALNDFTMKVLMVAAFVSIIVDVATAEDKNRSIAWIEGYTYSYQ